jgi:hypothetical protein
MNVCLCNMARRPFLKVQVPPGSEQYELIKESGDVTELPVSVRPGCLASRCLSPTVGQTCSFLYLHSSTNATDCEFSFIVRF